MAVQAHAPPLMLPTFSLVVVFLLKLIYFIEQPYEIRPNSFQSRIVASAR
jgi:hypothetical protein